MKIFFLGDIFGKPGRKAVTSKLSKIISEYKPDLVIANAENLAGGKGATVATLKEMEAAGVDVFTGGNHIFHESEIFTKNKNNLVRPANYPNCDKGSGYITYTTRNKQKVLIVNLLGRVFTNALIDCPFKTLEEILQKNSDQDFDAIIVDFHAEATSEKAALKWYFDGKISAILGTHTHVATCDAHITQNGTFFVSDVGMTGPFDSVIGIKKEEAFAKFLKAMPIKFNVASGKTIFQGFLLDILDKKTQNYERIEIFDL